MIGIPRVLTTDNTPSKRLKVALDPSVIDQLNSVSTAEYTPIIELKPGPGFSAIRDNATDENAVSLVNGELELDGTSALNALYTRRYDDCDAGGSSRFRDDRI